MKIWTVYAHISPSGKVYVGISDNIKNRWANKGKKYCTYNSIFKYAIEKYGWDNFQHQILLEGVSKSEAIYAEKYLIRWYKIHNMSYNITDGGEGTSGIKFSEERKQRAANAKIANRKDDYLIIDKNFNYTIFQTAKEAAEYLGGNIQNISCTASRPLEMTFKGYYIIKHEKGTNVDIETIKDKIQKALGNRHEKFSQFGKSRIDELQVAAREARAKMSSEERRKVFGSNGMKGKHHSEETKRKMSLSATGKGLKEAHIAGRKYYEDKATPIIVTKDSVFVGEYKIQGDIAKDLGINRSSISRALKNGYLVGGYCFCYKEGGVECS